MLFGLGCPNLAETPPDPQSRLVLKESLASWESPFQGAESTAEGTAVVVLA